MPFMDLDEHLASTFAIHSGLSEEAGIFEAQCYLRARRAELRRTGRRAGGKRTPPEVVEAVTKALATHETYLSIAHRFGISPPTVERIARKARTEALVARCALDTCGAIFTRRAWRGPGGHRYCSRRCRLRAWTRAKFGHAPRSVAPPKPEPVEHACFVCGNAFMPRRQGKGQNGQRYCGARCRSRRHQQLTFPFLARSASTSPSGLLAAAL